MSVVWTPRQEPACDPETESLSISVNRSLQVIGRLQVAVDHWKFMTFIFLGLFTGNVLVDAAALAWWWSFSK